MEEDDKNSIHGTAELATGNREDLFTPTVTDKLVNIVCGGCGACYQDHYSWEEHIRDMVELEDSEHSFYTQVLDGADDNVVLDGEYECADCGNGYRTETERDNHRLTIGTSVRLVCSQCACLVPDMELHLIKHKGDVKCGECGVYFTDLKSHMLDSHSGFMSVLILQTLRCAGDGSTLVSLEIVLATNARFLASEVKPIGADDLPAVKGQPKRKSAGDKLKDTTKKPVESNKKILEVVKKPVEVIKKPVVATKESLEATKKPQEVTKKTLISRKKPEDPKKRIAGGKKLVSLLRVRDEFSIKDEDEETMETSQDPNFGAKKIKTKVNNKTKKTGVIEKQVDVKDLFPQYELSERDRALCPPAYLPSDFFDESGNRVWTKLPTRLHQCELCGFNAKTKNKYREKQDHLMKWHFSKRIEKILPTTGKKPFQCPLCPFLGKDRQCVVRHYTGKHQALDVWMAEFLEAVTFKSLTEDILNTVENVDLKPRPEDIQRPFRARIVNTLEDLKDFLSGNYVESEQSGHQCDHCQQSFASSSALKSHKLIDHNKKKRSEKDKEIKAWGEETIESYLEDGEEGEVEEEQEQKKVVFKSQRLKNKREKHEELERMEVEDFEEVGEDEGIAEDKLLYLEDEEGSGLRCLTCSSSKIARLKSLLELKDHIQNNHMDLCRLDYFVQCQTNLPGSSMDKKFMYTLCSTCGKCFSQNSDDNVLETHRREHHVQDMEDLVETNGGKALTLCSEEIGDIDMLQDEFIEDSVFKASNEEGVDEFGDDNSDLEQFLSEDSDGVPGKTGRSSKFCICSNCRNPDYNPSVSSRVHTCILNHNCHKTFTKIAHLKAHVRSNNNERPYVCKYKGCKKSFVRREELRRHAWIHTKEARFRCECGMGYGRADHYRTHALKCSLSTADKSALLELLD